MKRAEGSFDLVVFGQIIALFDLDGIQVDAWSTEAESQSPSFVQEVERSSPTFGATWQLQAKSVQWPASESVLQWN